eukprot:scaffold293577_cov43-Prasinocladus_malaysianus.AAC.1
MHGDKKWLQPPALPSTSVKLTRKFALTPRRDQPGPGFGAGHADARKDFLGGGHPLARPGHIGLELRLNRQNTGPANHCKRPSHALFWIYQRLWFQVIVRADGSGTTDIFKRPLLPYVPAFQAQEQAGTLDGAPSHAQHTGLLRDCAHV